MQLRELDVRHDSTVVLPGALPQIVPRWRHYAELRRLVFIKLFDKLEALLKPRHPSAPRWRLPCVQSRHKPSYIGLYADSRSYGNKRDVWDMIRTRELNHI